MCLSKQRKLRTAITWRNVHTNVTKKNSLFSLATRESAFVHAIASAGVAFAVTRSCAEGTSTMCGCDSHHKGPPGEGWKWGGCSEDAEFGVLVSREFADARENRPDARSAMNRHNNEAGRMVRDSWSWFQNECSKITFKSLGKDFFNTFI